MSTLPAAPRGELPVGHELVEGTPHHAVTIYGADWCEDTVRVRALLERLGIEYNYYNVDLDPGIRRTMEALEGGASDRVPVVRMDDRVLVEPTDDALTTALQETGRI